MKPAAGVPRFASMARLLLPRQHHRFLFMSRISNLRPQCPLRHCPVRQDPHVDSSASLPLGVFIFHPLFVQLIRRFLRFRLGLLRGRGPRRGFGMRGRRSSLASGRLRIYRSLRVGRALRGAGHGEWHLEKPLRSRYFCLSPVLALEPAPGVTLLTSRSLWVYVVVVQVFGELWVNKFGPSLRHRGAFPPRFRAHSICPGSKPEDRHTTMPIWTTNLETMPTSLLPLRLRSAHMHPRGLQQLALPPTPTPARPRFNSQSPKLSQIAQHPQLSSSPLDRRATQSSTTFVLYHGNGRISLPTLFLATPHVPSSLVSSITACIPSTSTRASERWRASTT